MDVDMLKKLILSIVTTNPDGITSRQMIREYKEMEGERIPYGNYGYRSLELFIANELAENVSIRKDASGLETIFVPVATEKSGHILELKKGEKKRTNVKRNVSNQRNYNHNHQSTHQPSNRQKYEYGLLPTPNLMPQMHPPQLNFALQPMNRSTIPIQYMAAIQQLNQHQYQNQHQNQYQNRNQYPNQNQHKNFNRQIERPVQQPLPACSQRNQIQNQPFQQRNSNTTPAPNHPITPVVSTNPPTPPRMTKTQFFTQELQKMVQSQQNSSSESAKDSLKTVIRHPKADANTSPANETANNFDEQRTVSSESWDDVLDEAIAADLDNTAAMRDIDKVSYAERFYESCVSDGNDNKSMPELIKALPFKSLSISTNDLSMWIPSTKYLWTKLTVGMVVNCIVSEVNNPLKFWIRLNEYEDKFNALIHDMTAFYNNDDNKVEYELWPDEVDNYEMFAIEFDDEWYRVSIESNGKGGSVEVRYIDTGARQPVLFAQLYRLPAQFIQVPVMVVCCGLDNIRPIGSKFTIASAKKFVEIVENEKLFATVLKIEEVKSKVLVELTIKSNKLSVNQELVRIGHAKPCSKKSFF